MDTDKKLKATWLLEFLLLKPVPDWTVHHLLRRHPPLNTYRLKKLVLLRRIINELVLFRLTDRTLESLELIDELDRREGVPPLPSLKLAYCATAVELTVPYLRTNDDYEFNKAFYNIWTNKVSDLEQHQVVGLLSDELIVWRGWLDVFRKRPEIKEKILRRDTRREALDAVRAYVKDVMQQLGPSFLERIDQVLGETAVNLEQHLPNCSRRLGVDGDIVPEPVGAASVMQSGDCVSSHADGLEGDHTRSATGALNVQGLNPTHAKGTTFEETMTDAMHNADVSEGNKSRMDVDVSTEEDPNPTHVEDTGSGITSTNIMQNKNQNTSSLEQISSSIEQNPTTCTDNVIELDDDSSKSTDNEKIIKRRKYSKWTTSEEDCLRKAVKRFGEGRWSLIKSHYPVEFKERTELNLKDKWRTMTR